MKHILVADIGGTNCRLAHFSLKKDTLQAEVWTRIPTATIHTTHDLLAAFQNAELGLSLQKADIIVLAVAGHVDAFHHVRATNADLEIDLHGINSEYGIKKAVLINDFTAQAYACLTEVGRKARCILEGNSGEVSTNCIGIIGAGTGLGTGSLVFHTDRWLPIPSESGHAVFPFVGPEEAAYENFIRKTCGLPYATGDDVLTGNGLTLLALYLEGIKLTPEEISLEFLSHETQLQQWYARFYGRACRNWILTSLCTGGLYIAGGIAAKNPAVTDCTAFRQELLLSPTYSDLLASVPVHLITDERSGLWGAARAGMEILSDSK